MSHPQRSEWAARLARLAEAEGEQDVDLLSQHRANLLMEEAVGIAQQGQDLRSLIQAVGKWVKASVLAPLPLEQSTLVALDKVLTASKAITEAELASCDEAIGQTALEIIFLFWSSIHKPEGAAERREWVIILVNYSRLVCEDPQLVDDHLRLLGTELTAAESERCCLEAIFFHARNANACYAQRLDAVRRLHELIPSARHSALLAQTERDGGNARAAYAAAMRGMAGARREGSFFFLYKLSMFAAFAVIHGALGPTWRSSQIEPFLENARDAAPHLRHWMPRALFQDMVAAHIQLLEELESVDVGEARRAIPAQAKDEATQSVRTNVLRRCDSCGTQEPEMRKCSACKAAFYCGAACQKRHWKEHKKECREAVAAQRTAGGAGVGGEGE